MADTSQAKPVVKTKEELMDVKIEGESNDAGKEEHSTVDDESKPVLTTEQGLVEAKTEAGAEEHKPEGTTEADAKNNAVQRTTKKRENKSKFDPSLAEISSDPEEIRKQVCFHSALFLKILIFLRLIG
jgi:hypothetical protein